MSLWRCSKAIQIAALSCFGTYIAIPWSRKHHWYPPPPPPRPSSHSPPSAPEAKAGRMARQRDSVS